MPPEALVVHADRAQLEQVILNLVLNARDAMPEGGNVDTVLEADDDTVTLTVSDHGMGIDDRTIQHIFEPFFTTKTHGTGLGLSTVHTIVQQNGGSIDVSSIPTQGTAFTVRLPRT
jgi:signal transduction histidine kinase